MADSGAIAETIVKKQRAIEVLKREIRDLAKEHIPDFHFLDYAVSTFWKCEASPIGMCIFRLNERGQPTTCRYCNDPVERK